MVDALDSNLDSINDSFDESDVNALNADQSILGLSSFMTKELKK